jgi:hypothetical protein
MAHPARRAKVSRGELLARCLRGDIHPCGAVSGLGRPAREARRKHGKAASTADYPQAIRRHLNLPNHPAALLVLSAVRGSRSPPAQIRAEHLPEQRAHERPIIAHKSFIR